MLFFVFASRDSREGPEETPTRADSAKPRVSGPSTFFEKQRHAQATEEIADLELALSEGRAPTLAQLRRLYHAADAAGRERVAVLLQSVRASSEVASWSLHLLRVARSERTCELAAKTVARCGAWEWRSELGELAQSPSVEPHRRVLAEKLLASMRRAKQSNGALSLLPEGLDGGLSEPDDAGGHLSPPSSTEVS